MQKIKILYLYSSKGFGGIVRNISILAHHLHKENFKVVVVALTNRGDKDAELELSKDSDVLFRRIDEKSVFDLSSINQVNNLIKEFGIDILSCHGYKADFYGFILRAFYNVHLKLIAVAHGWVMPGPKLWFYSVLDKLVMRCFDRIILVSPSLQQDIRGFAIQKKKIILINNAIDPDEFKKKDDRAAARKAFTIEDNEFVIGFAGRLDREKNIETILLALKELSSTNKTIKLLIAGDGPSRDRLSKSAKDLGIERSVIFAGYQKDIKKIYSVFDLYILASFKEGLSNSLLEAQASGVPCVVSDIGGNNEIVKDGENGFLFDPKDHRDLAQKIRVLMENRDLAGRFILEGKKMIGERFSLRERISKFEKLYHDVIAE